MRNRSLTDTTARSQLSLKTRTSVTLAKKCHPVVSNMSDTDVEENMDDEPDKMMTFVTVIKDHGKDLLSKSKLPHDVEKKKRAISHVIQAFAENGVEISEKQIKRRMANIEQMIKRRLDAKQTGNRPIVLNYYQKVWLEMLDYGKEERNPKMVKLSYGASVGFTDVSSPSHLPQPPATSVSSATTASSVSVALHSGRGKVVSSLPLVSTGASECSQSSPIGGVRAKSQSKRSSDVLNVEPGNRAHGYASAAETRSS